MVLCGCVRRKSSSAMMMFVRWCGEQVRISPSQQEALVLWHCMTDAPLLASQLDGARFDAYGCVAEAVRAMGGRGEPPNVESVYAEMRRRGVPKMDAARAIQSMADELPDGCGDEDVDDALCALGG